MASNTWSELNPGSCTTIGCPVLSTLLITNIPGVLWETTDNWHTDQSTINTMIDYKFCHGREFELGQFHLRLHILRSESRLAEFLMKENVNQKLELSHLTFLTIIVPNIKGMDPSSFFFNVIKDWNALPNSITINKWPLHIQRCSKATSEKCVSFNVININSSSYHSFNLSDIHLKQPIENKWKCFHEQSLEVYQLISAF